MNNKELGLHLLEKIEQITTNAKQKKVKKLASREKLIGVLTELNTSKLKKTWVTRYAKDLHEKAMQGKIDLYALQAKENELLEEAITHEEERIQSLTDKQLIQEIMHNSEELFYWSTECDIDNYYAKDEIALLIEIINYLLD
jgi:hypothetical protein